MDFVLMHLVIVIHYFLDGRDHTFLSDYFSILRIHWIEFYEIIEDYGFWCELGEIDIA